MRKHFGQTKAQRQAEWLASFNDALVTLHPRLTGRIDWNAALHYYFSGKTVDDAVMQYCIARNIDEDEGPEPPYAGYESEAQLRRMAEVRALRAKGQA